MRLTITLPLCGALFGVLVVLSTPAAATQIKEAIKLCKKNPACKFTIDGDGGATLHVGDNVVSCPKTGDCNCVVCNPPARKAPSAKPSVSGVLSGSSRAQ
jgi:hypothetical protein